jgi:hypothetical protein
MDKIIELTSSYNLDKDFVYVPYEWNFHNYLLVLYKIQNTTSHDNSFHGYHIASHARFHVARIIDVTTIKCVFYCDRFTVGFTNNETNFRYWTHTETAIMRLYCDDDFFRVNKKKIEYDQNGNVVYTLKFVSDNIRLQEYYSLHDKIILKQQFSGRGIFDGEQQAIYPKRNLFEDHDRAKWNATSGQYQFISKIFEIRGNVKSGLFNLITKDMTGSNDLTIFDISCTKHVKIDTNSKHWRFWPQEILRKMD